MRGPNSVVNLMVELEEKQGISHHQNQGSHQSIKQFLRQFNLDQPTQQHLDP